MVHDHLTNNAGTFKLDKFIRVGKLSLGQEGQWPPLLPIALIASTCFAK